MTKQAEAFCRKLLAAVLAAGFLQPAVPGDTPVLAAAPNPTLFSAEQDIGVCEVLPEDAVQIQCCQLTAASDFVSARDDDYEEMPYIRVWLAKDPEGNHMAYTPSTRYTGCKYYLFYRIFYQSTGEICTDKNYTVHLEATNPDNEAIHSADYSTEYTYTGENDNTYYGGFNYISFNCTEAGSYGGYVSVSGDIEGQASTGWRVKEKNLSFKTWISDSPFGDVRTDTLFLPGQKFYVCYNLYDKDTNETVADTMGANVFTVDVTLLSPGGGRYAYSCDSNYFYSGEDAYIENENGLLPGSRQAREFTRGETGTWTAQFQLSGALTTDVIERSFVISDEAAPPSTQGLQIFSSAPLSPEGKFLWGHDNWNFDNIDSYFTNSYAYNEQTRYAFAKLFGFNHIENEFSRWIALYAGDMDFGGACYGMAVGELLYKKGLLDFSALGLGMDAVPFANGDSPAALSVSNFLYWLQNIPCAAQCERYADSIGTLQNYSQGEFCKKLEEAVIGDEIVVLIYKTQYTAGGTAGHAVLAYGVEEGRYSFNGQPYDRRILICDPNYSAGNTPNDKACLYYNTADYSWVVPYQTTDKKSLYWNAEDGAGYPHGYIDQILQFPSLRECTDLMTEEAGKQENYFSGMHILHDGHTGYRFYTRGGTVTPGELPVPVEPFFSRTYSTKDLPRSAPLVPIPNNQGSDWSSSHFNLHDTPRPYELVCDEPCDTLTMLDYEHIGYAADLHGATNVYYHPDRHIEAKGEELIFDLMIINEDGWGVTDWYSMDVYGAGCNIIRFEMTKDGYLLTTDTPCDVGFFAENDDFSASAYATPNTTSCKIIELTPSVIGVLTDSDGDGDYTELVYPPALVFGDTDYDEDITLNDALIALDQYTYQIMGIREPNFVQVMTGDVTGDGSIDLTDIVCILDYFSHNSLLMEPVTWREVTGNPNAPDS